MKHLLAILVALIFAPTQRALALDNNSTAKQVFLDKTLPRTQLGPPQFHRIGAGKKQIRWREFVQILQEEADPTVKRTKPQLESTKAGDFRVLSFEIHMTGKNRGSGRLLVHADDGVAVYLKKSTKTWGDTPALHKRYKKGQAFPNIWGTTPVHGRQRPALRSCHIIDYQLEDNQSYDCLVLYSNTWYQKPKTGAKFRDYDGFSAHVIMENKRESFNLTVDRDMKHGNKPLTAGDENDEADEELKSRCCVIDVTNNIPLKEKDKTDGHIFDQLLVSARSEILSDPSVKVFLLIDGVLDIHKNIRK